MMQELVTARLRILIRNKEAYEALFARHSDAELMQLLGMDDEAQLQREKQKVVQGMCTYRTSLMICHLQDADTKEIIGSFAFHNWYPEHRRSEIGYYLRPAYREKGFMREALSVLIPYGFEQLNLNRIEAIIAPDNEASKALVAGWRFRQEGLLKEHYIVAGQTEDSLIFGLTLTEYDQMIANKG